MWADSFCYQLSRDKVYLDYFSPAGANVPDRRDMSQHLHARSRCERLSYMGELSAVSYVAALTRRGIPVVPKRGDTLVEPSGVDVNQHQGISAPESAGTSHPHVAAADNQGDWSISHVRRSCVGASHVPISIH
jgi:hypothetical protein